ncbi:MAG: hypothetical protein AB8B97_16365 [Granulosicoccus sp.]
MTLTTVKVKPVVVVAGYGGWAQAAVNPSTEVVAALNRLNPEQYLLHCLDMPVDTTSLYERLDSAMQQYKPDIWIGIGVAVGSPAIRLEAIGINVRCFSVPDVNGVTLPPTPVIDGGPVAYQSNLKCEKVVQSLQTSGIPAVLSYHAGTHLCNQMLYSVLHLGEKKAMNLLGVFVHVPQSTSNAANASDGVCSSMSLSMMTSALEMTIDCAVGQFNAAP